jgi:sugar-specific transcriptional regulator TrmB
MTKRDTSLRVEIAVWFALNPDEALTAADTAAKFDVDRTQCYDCFSSLRRDGYVERIEWSYPRQWRAGPALLRMVSAAKAVAS